MPRISDPATRLEHHYHAIVQAQPHELAVVDTRGHRLTHAQLWESAGRAEAALGEHGIGPGSAVIIGLPNWSEWMSLFLGALRLGAVPATVPLATAADAELLRYLAELTGAGAIVVPAAFRGTAYGDIVQDVVGSLSHRCAGLLVDAHAGWQWLAGPGQRAPGAGVQGTHHMMFTSSTTGRPKAVMHTNATLAAMNIGFASRYRLTAATPIFMGSPLGHSVGAIHGARLALFLGAPLVLQDRWDPEQAIQLMAAERCAFTAAATPFLKDLVDAPAPPGSTKLATLRAFLCGGADIPPDLIRAAGDELPGTFVAPLWGMTEGGVTCVAPGAPPEKVRGTVGTPLPGLELAILDPDGRHLPPGGSGELAMRGPGVFIGYWGQEELYRSSVSADGFFRTGDLAHLDDDGYVVLAGRLKDLIIRGGVNIAPARIEAALFTHPRVRQIAVVGLPDERLGERICAVVVGNGAPPDLPSLLTWAKDQGLPKPLWPEALLLVDEMPVTPAGKIRKHELRARLRDGAAGRLQLHRFGNRSGRI